MKEFFKKCAKTLGLVSIFPLGYLALSWVFNVDYYSRTISRDGTIVERSLRINSNTKSIMKEEELAKLEGEAAKEAGLETVHKI